MYKLPSCTVDQFNETIISQNHRINFTLYQYHRLIYAFFEVKYTDCRIDLPIKVETFQSKIVIYYLCLCWCNNKCTFTLTSSNERVKSAQ